MVDFVECRGQVCVQNPSALRVFPAAHDVDDRDRVLTTSARPEPIRSGREPGLPLGFQRVPAARLVSAISYRGDRVVIGMDPHKRSATIEVMAADETVLGTGRFATDRAGFAVMADYVKQWPSRVWAIEGCEGIGRHIATRLLADGEQVVDVPPKLSARARVFVTGQGRKTDATDAHCVALVGTRMSGLRPVVNDEQLAVLRLLVDRRRLLGDDHTRMACQLHQLLLELIPGGAKKDLSAAQAKALLATVRPRDAVGKARRAQHGQLGVGLAVNGRKD